MLQGIQVSSGGVRGVWQRHGLLTKHERLLRLERTTVERRLTLSDEQIRLLERYSPEFRERHIEAPHTGALVAVDTFFMGTLKRDRKMYLQTADECQHEGTNTVAGLQGRHQAVESEKGGAQDRRTERHPNGGRLILPTDAALSGEHPLCTAWTDEPSRFIHDPHHQIPGPNI